MKTIFKTGLIGLILISGVNASAQTSPLSFGVKGGINLSNYRGDIDDTKAKVGFNVGLTVELALPSNLYLMSGLELTTKGAKNIKGEEEIEQELYMRARPFSRFSRFGFDMGENIIEANLKGPQNATYLQLPVYLGYKINVHPCMKLSVHTGPYLAYGIGGKLKFDNEVTFKDSHGYVLTAELAEKTINELGLDKEYNTFGKDGLKEFDFGLGFGVGAEFGKIGVNLGYDLGLTNISRDKDEKINTMNAHLSLGYKF